MICQARQARLGFGHLLMDMHILLGVQDAFHGMASSLGAAQRASEARGAVCSSHQRTAKAALL